MLSPGGVRLTPDLPEHRVDIVWASLVIISRSCRFCTARVVARRNEVDHLELSQPNVVSVRIPASIG